MKIISIRTTPVIAPLPRPVRTASGTIDRFPLVLIDVRTDTGVEGRAYAQVYLPELLRALDRPSPALRTWPRGCRWRRVTFTPTCCAVAGCSA